MEGFLALLSTILFGIVFWAVSKDRLDSMRENLSERQRRDAIVTLQRQHVGVNEDACEAWDRLGDALRAAGHPADAIVAWNTADEKAANGGVRVSTDTDRKRRLANLDIISIERPGSLRQTLHSREQVCRRCGSLNPPALHACAACKASLPASRWSRVGTGQHREELLAELLPKACGVAVLIVAIMLATYLPVEVRGVLAISCLLVLPFWWLKHFGEGRK